MWFFQVPVDIYRLICWQGPCSSKFGQISFGCPGFRGFPPLFRRRLPLFSRRRCMRRQATAWHGRKFSSGGKKAAFNLLMWVLPNLIPRLGLGPHNLIFVVKLMFQHDGVGVGRVYWFLAAVVFSCMPFSDVCFFQSGFCRSFGFFPMCVFSQSGFCRSFGQMKTRATPLTAPTLRPLYFTTVKPT